ncbi:hypothetical protein Hamer_G021278 [Homarus americanus]|uniref:Uncharacterized protein n=1 Tax=Homarus americanus TaxID=6706 RepID=A0A8J5JSP7_HOMAM|nr:hypothetical protein Hamer_G021278 [Homarus americanus]
MGSFATKARNTNALAKVQSINVVSAAKEANKAVAEKAVNIMEVRTSE